MAVPDDVKPQKGKDRHCIGIFLFCVLGHPEVTLSGWGNIAERRINFPPPVPLPQSVCSSQRAFAALHHVWVSNR